MFDTLLLSARAGRYAYLAEGKLWAFDAIEGGRDIYRVRVTRRAPSLGGVFADAGDCSVLVRVKDEPMPQEGDYLLVWQEEKAQGTKKAVCRLHPTLAGRYVVLTPHSEALSFAKGLPQDVRDAYRAAGFAGCIIRSAVVADSVAYARAELTEMRNVWHQIATHVGVGLVYQAPADYTQYLGLARTVCADDEALCAQYGLHYDPDVADKIERLVSAEPIDARVVTPEGVELVVEHTEACWVVDVNSYLYTPTAPQDNAAYALNRIAAKEAMRQLSLRNATGAILIDFVNMSAAKRKPFLDYLSEIAVDARVHVVGLTQLGFAELTRSGRLAERQFK